MHKDHATFLKGAWMIVISTRRRKFGATLEELNDPQELIIEVVAICETTRNDVLGR